MKHFTMSNVSLNFSNLRFFILTTQSDTFLIYMTLA